LLKDVVVSLEKLGKQAASAPEAVKVEEAIKTSRAALQTVRDSAGENLKGMLTQLDSELSTWQSKLSVILKEPAARQGMSKHVNYWVERLKNVS